MKSTEDFNDFGEFRKRGMEVMEEAIKAVWEMANGDNLVDLDAMLREEAGKVFRELMGMALSARGGKGRCGNEIRCQCGGNAGFRQYRERRLETVLQGKDVDVTAAYYLCAKCRKATIPLLREMGIGSDGVTVSLRELVVLAGAVDSYEEASSILLKKMSGINMGSVRIQMMTVAEGEAAGKYMEETQIECGDEESLRVEIDGGMVHVDDRWQEVKLGVIFGSNSPMEVSDGRTKLMRRDFVAVRGGPEELAIKMEKCLPANVASRRVVVVGDGAKWIWNFAEEQFPNRVEILDYYHAAEHLNICASVLFGEGCEKAKAWVDEQEELLMADNVQEIIATLEALFKTLRASAKRKAVGSLIGYLKNNSRRMRYKTFINSGLPIGSGAVESAVKHLVQQRMKGPGMRWHSKGADSMLNLRCIFRSTGKWSDFWNCKKNALKAA